MYQDELRREARLVMQGWQAWVRDFAVRWSSFTARLGGGRAKPPGTDAGLR